MNVASWIWGTRAQNILGVGTLKMAIQYGRDLIGAWLQTAS